MKCAWARSSEALLSAKCCWQKRSRERLCLRLERRDPGGRSAWNHILRARTALEWFDPLSERGEKYSTPHSWPAMSSMSAETGEGWVVSDDKSPTKGLNATPMTEEDGKEGEGRAESSKTCVMLWG